MVLIRILILTFFLSTIIADDFTNVTVLDIKFRSDMKRYMKRISKDLGVKCSYCHDMDDKSLDTPKKDITREMIKLTHYLNDLLNIEKKDTINHTTYVTCWTCHYGKTQPASIRLEE